VPERPLPPPVPAKPAVVQVKPKKPSTPISEKAPSLASSPTGTPPVNVVRPAAPLATSVRPPFIASIATGHQPAITGPVPQTIPGTINGTPRPVAPVPTSVRPIAPGQLMAAPSGQPRPHATGIAPRPGVRPPGALGAIAWLKCSTTYDWSCHRWSTTSGSAPFGWNPHGATSRQRAASPTRTCHPSARHRSTTCSETYSSQSTIASWSQTSRCEASSFC
jgi:hypothetical protein